MAFSGSPFLDEAPASWSSSGPVVLIINAGRRHVLVPEVEMTPEKRADLRTGLSTEAILAWLHQFPTLDVPTDGRVVPLHDILPNATIVEIMTCRDSI
jgi:hypothetical protein